MNDDETIQARLNQLESRVAKADDNIRGLAYLMELQILEGRELRRGIGDLPRGMGRLAAGN